MKVEIELPDVYCDKSIKHYTEEPPCGKHLTDDVLEDRECFIYVNDISRVTCKDCLKN